MQNKPVLIEAAMGTRGRYRVVETIPDEKMPLGTTWLFDYKRRYFDQGFDRVRISVWIPWRSEYSRW